MDKIIRVPAVLERIGMCRAWLYKAIAEGRFPQGVKIGERARGWRSSDVDAWVAARTYS